MKNHNMYKTSILTWLQENAPLIYGVILSIIIAYGRLTYDGIGGRRKWVEALLCGALSLAASSGLDYFDLSMSLNPFIGGAIGFLGVDKLRQISNSILNKKMDINNDDPTH